MHEPFAQLLTDVGAGLGIEVVATVGGPPIRASITDRDHHSGEIRAKTLD